MTDAQRRATLKYRQAHTKRIAYDIPIDIYDAWRSAAAIADQSMRGYIVQAVNERVQREKSAPASDGE